MAEELRAGAPNAAAAEPRRICVVALMGTRPFPGETVLRREMPTV